MRLFPERQGRLPRFLISPGLRDGSNAISASTHAVASSYFEVRGRLRLDSAVVEERSLVFKQRGDVRTLWRERGGLSALDDTALGPKMPRPTSIP